MKTTFNPRTLPIRVACAFLLITAMTLPPRPRKDFLITLPMPDPVIALSSNAGPVGETSEVTPIIYRTYTINNVRGAKPLAQIKSEVGEENLAAVLKLNRVDDAHLRTGETILIPERVTDFIALSPFPREVETAREIPRLLVVSRRVQAFGAYEFGRLVRWGPTSTGKKHTPTPAGLYHANWRSKATRSTVNPAWLLRWYVNIDNARGIAVHEYELPGYPASHSCVRMQADDAAWFYHWAVEGKLSADGKSVDQGTPVLVFGEYTYGEKPPWKQLETDSHATTVTKIELEEALLPHTGKI